jgi:hypothetical protein
LSILNKYLNYLVGYFFKKNIGLRQIFGLENPIFVMENHC